MSKQKDSEDLVRVGPGTVMGEMMRQYWIPAAMSNSASISRSIRWRASPESTG